MLCIMSKKLPSKFSLCATAVVMETSLVNGGCRIRNISRNIAHEYPKLSSNINSKENDPLDHYCDFGD